MSVRAEGARAFFGSLLELQVVPSEHVLQGETGHWDRLLYASFLHILVQTVNSPEISSALHHCNKNLSCSKKA